MFSNNQKDLVMYFKKNLSKGYTLDSLKIALLNQGYPKLAVEQAIKTVNESLAKMAPVFNEKPKIKYAIIDENDKPIAIKKSWWKQVFG
ncbi:MAG: hypothetical protein KKF67_01465 [Nanoarchaeota archaeon]|nr:hypothetical protein [Nanoarchaeota archaeon]